MALDPALFETLWPIFAAEAREHLNLLSAGVGAVADDPAMGARLRRAAHSLKGSAASLGLSDFERLCHAIEDALPASGAAAPPDPAVADALQEALRALDRALDRGDSGAAPGLEALPALLQALGAAPDPGRGAAAAAAAAPDPALAELDALEEALIGLRAPSVQDRPGLAREAAARTARLGQLLAGAGRSASLPAAEKVRAGFERFAEPGVPAHRATAAVAGALVELRESLLASAAVAPPARAQPPPAPPPLAAPPSPAAGEGQRALDRMIRVSEQSVEGLSRSLEHLALSGGRQERHTRALQEANARLGALLRSADAKKAPEPLLSGLRQLELELRRLHKDASRETEQLRLSSTVVRGGLRDLRMVPAQQLLDGLRRTARDAAAKVSRQVELVTSGGEVRIDRRILEALKDPLVHLVRNAIDHGVEPAEARRAAGKPAAAKVAIRIEARGELLVVEVSDDGRGLSLEKIRAAAVSRGLLSAEAAAQTPDKELARLIFRAGFSTASRITALSGRGIGLDVVQDTLRQLQGAVDVRSVAGAGTTFVVEVPLTLAGTVAVVIAAGRERLALAAANVERVVRVRAEELGTVANRPVVRLPEGQLAVASLARTLGLPSPRATSGGNQPGLLVHAGDQRMVLLVDEVVSTQELLVRPLGRHGAALRHLAGAAIQENGRAIPVLNVQELIRRARPEQQAQHSERQRILVADDSLTTRTAMKALLEIAGYSVVPAGDGEEALRALRELPCQLVVSDVQMPRLDGLGLTRRLRADPALREVPVILVTSLESAEDRAAGLHAGADGYLVKRDVERGKLLELVRQLMPRAAPAGRERP